MARYSKVRGKSVMTATEGKNVGKVDHLLVDPDQKKVIWVKIDNPGLFTGHRWASASAVRTFGEDRVLVNTEADLRDESAVPDIAVIQKAKRDMVGKRVVTSEGKYIGDVQDFEFDPPSLAVTGIMVSYGGLLDKKYHFTIDQVETIGVDAVIVNVSERALESSLSDTDETGEPPATTPPATE